LSFWSTKTLHCSLLVTVTVHCHSTLLVDAVFLSLLFNLW
jgi:hypothetical protein